MRSRRYRALDCPWRLALAASVFGGIVLYGNGCDRPVLNPHPDGEQRRQDAVPSTPTMDESQRQFLWEIEHAGNVLSRQGFKKLANILSQGDEAALTALLAPEFKGQVLQQPREVRVRNDYVDIVRQEDAGHPPAALRADQFRQRLCEYRRLFTWPPKVQLALMALAPTVRQDMNSPWQGTCQLRMWGEMGGGPGEVTLYLQFQVARPTSGKEAASGWLQACAITQSQVGRSPRFLLREVAAERGIDRRRFHDNWLHGMRGTTTGGVYLCDYNRDGILDMLVVDLNGVVLYQGLPDGKFADVTREVGLPWQLEDPSGSNLAAAFVDLDGDGWEDLILDRRIFRNEAGKRFTEVTQRSNLRLPGEISGFAIADYDLDGRLDLYVARLGPAKASSWLDGKCGGQAGNLLLRNKGNWQFEDVTTASGAAGGDRSTFSAVWLDANNDGWPDLYVINEFGNGVLLVNQGDGTFREQALVEGPADFGSMGVTAGDIDNDGNIDLYVANMYSKAGRRVIGNVAEGTYSAGIMATMRSFVAGSQLWHNLGPRASGLGPRASGAQQRGILSPAPRAPHFEPLGQKYQVASVGWAYGPALVDLDNDGWLDLYATAGFVSQSRTEPDG